MSDQVNVFVSFSADDNKYYNNLVGLWTADIEATVRSRVGPNAAKFYFFEREHRTIPWQEVQDIELRSGDVFVPFVTGSYLSNDPQDERYRELEQALTLAKAGQLDMFTVILSTPPPVLPTLAQAHWERLQKAADFVPLGTEKNDRPIRDYQQVRSKDRDSTKAPEELKRAFVKYVNEQWPWVLAGRQGVRPSWKGHENQPTQPVKDRGRTSGALGRYVLKTAPWIDPPECVMTYDTPPEMNDPCSRALVDELIMLLETRPSDGLVRSWLDTNLGAPSL